MPTIRQSKKHLSPRKIKSIKALAQKIDSAESASIRAQGRTVFARHHQLRSIVEALKTHRLSQGVSLSTLSRTSGIAKPNLSRLENSSHSVPTLDTLERYARALGMTIQIELTTAHAA